MCNLANLRRPPEKFTTHPKKCKFSVTNNFRPMRALSMNETIRHVTKADAKALLDIYSYYVKNTAITFEYEIPTLEEFEKRIETITQKYPYLCIEKDGRILGYAYASTFKPREAYKWNVELSIYVDRGTVGKGLGRRLYEALEKELKAMGIINLYACIGVPNGEDDEYLTHNSEQFHEHLGFKTVGTFRNCGKKFNRWYAMIWMEKVIGEHV